MVRVRSENRLSLEWEDSQSSSVPGPATAERSQSAGQLPERLQGRLVFPGESSEGGFESGAAAEQDWEFAEEAMQKPDPIFYAEHGLMPPAVDTPLVPQWDDSFSHSFPHQHPQYYSHVGSVFEAAQGCNTFEDFQQLASHSDSLLDYSMAYIAKPEGLLSEQLREVRETKLTIRQHWQDKFCLMHGWGHHSTSECRTLGRLLGSGCPAPVFYEHLLVHPGFSWRRQQQGVGGQQQQPQQEQQQQQQGEGNSKKRRKHEQRGGQADIASRVGESAPPAEVAGTPPRQQAEVGAISTSMAALQLENEQLRARVQQLEEQVQHLRKQLNCARHMVGKVSLDNAMLMSGEKI